ncbi:hypothetical protein POX_b02268 [Penicillium oxalicum]|uniref:hypothetical protein n=1 Tax=Penicillium oxalicum TaxID=69781 RepID=UPI0020B66EC3|nr:hypothetical protein POX_b02268 [Penicillium oxalicum]KAI2792231.1 hypothetical protein POX_b02268 [Penicillium oxalicum]
MRTRRSHQKSRTGCSNCKRRRVKCDEARPACLNCTQRKDACVYVALSPFVFSSNPGKVRTPSSTPSQTTNLPNEYTSPQPSAPSLTEHDPPSRAPARVVPPNLDHLALELQWIMHTHKLCARNEESRRVWQISTLEEALHAPFLMHGILAMSALHFVHLQKDGRQAEWLDLAISHKSEALALFHEQLQSIDESNAKAMMSFAGIAVAFSFASALNCSSPDDGPSVNALVDLLMLSRGVQTIINHASDFLRNSNFGPLFDTTDIGGALPSDLSEALNHLEELNLQCGRASPAHKGEMYKLAIEHLRSLGPYAYVEPGSLTFVGGWAIRTPRDYLDELRNREPFALVILAHFCVLLNNVRQNWCIGPWGRVVLGEIVQTLDTDWQCHIKWPIVQVLK